jgi:hypothetical protein
MLDSLSRARLMWMFDNQPTVVKEFLQKNQIRELDQLLMTYAKTGWDLFHNLQEKGKTYEEAYEQAFDAVIPKDGPEFSENPPRPLSLKDQEEAWRRLDLLEQARERLQEVPKKKTTT